MALYQKGETRAFEEIYERHSGRVFGYLCKRMNDKTEAEDLLQQTFLKLHKSRGRYNKDYPFLPWLFAIVRNIQIDFFRKHKATPIEIEKLQIPEQDQSTESSSDSPIVDASIEGLTLSQRELINLRFQQGLSFDEISKKVGITPSTARKQVSRLIRKLRTLFKKTDREEVL